MPPLECTFGGWWPLGCGIVSAAKDTVNSSISGFFAGILESIASWLWSFISGAFGVSDVDDSQWTAVQGLTSWWVVVMMTPLVAVMILQLVSGFISQQPRRIWRALIGGFVAVPVVGGAVYLMQALTHVSDSASTALLATMGSDPYVVFMRLFGFQRGPAGSGQAWIVSPIGGQATTGDQITGTIVITVLATLIVWVLAFILMCSMIFRSFALIVLAAVAPVALMLMPWEKTKSWAGRWCELVVALLLAKPLAATVLAVAVKLYANSTSFAGMAAGAVGMTLACAAPLMALKLVGFAGGELAAAAQTAGGGHLAHTGASFAGRQLGQQLRGHRILSSGSSAKSPKVVQSSTKPETAHVKDSTASGSTSSPDAPKIQQRPGAAATPQAPAAQSPTAAGAGQPSAPPAPGRQQKSGQPRSPQSPPTGSPAQAGKTTPAPPQPGSPGVPRPSTTSTNSEPGSPRPSSGPKPRPPASPPQNPPIRPRHTGGHHD
ncbi:type IV secretion system protein [Arthrobacter sp. GMC3]|uniref:type IV secretion system protein n=1 Tax=Arthrobacter sp. GMC3 TaxID=2058894 RepID=UPI000CE4A903|nr:type IV secretion system protein [Arthrobacter sp. GMC3]